ncbi:hypothetical protein ACH4KO_29190 [Streptomyces anulatus]
MATGPGGGGCESGARAAAGLGVAAERAPRLLAERLTDRLEETGGEALVAKPYGWLIGRGLVRRPSCTDRRCDDGTRLNTGRGGR